MYLNIKKGKVILFRDITLHSKTIKYSKDEITLKIWILVISGGSERIVMNKAVTVNF